MTSQQTDRRRSADRGNGTRDGQRDAAHELDSTDASVIDAAASATTGDDDAVDSAAVRAAINTHGERIKQREVQQALQKLDANGELTEAQREIVEEMATVMLDELLSTPDAVLAAADDPETLRTVVELFDPSK